MVCTSFCSCMLDITLRLPPSLVVYLGLTVFTALIVYSYTLSIMFIGGTQSYMFVLLLYLR